MRSDGFPNDRREMSFNNKSAGIKALLNAISPNPIGESIENEKCSFCGGPVHAFSTELVKAEYAISGMCEPCQVIAFAPMDDDGLEIEWDE